MVQYESILGSDGVRHQVLDTDTEIVPLCALEGFGPDHYHIEQSETRPFIDCVRCLHAVIDFLEDELLLLKEEDPA